MNNSKLAALLVTGTVAALVACGGGGGTNAPSTPQRTTSVAGVAVFTIPLSTPQGRHARFVSFGVKSATIAVNGTVVTTADLSAGSALCQVVNEGPDRICTIPLSATAGNDTFTATLFDGPNGTGHVLGIGTATQTIGGTTFSIPITVGGVVASLTITAQTTTLVSGRSATIPLTITARDAAGQVIAGADPFANPIPLTLSDTSGHTRLSTTSLISPQTPVNLTYDGGALSGNVVVGATGGTTTTIVPLTVAVATIPTGSFTGGYSCSGTSQLALPGTYLIFLSFGVLDTSGAYVSQVGEWLLLPFAAPTGAPSPTATPIATPVPTPVPTSSPFTLTLFAGNFTLNAPINGMQGGCFYAISIPANLQGTPGPAPSGSPTPVPNFLVLGAPNVGNAAVVVTATTPPQSGTATAVNLTVNQAAGTGSGTFTLDSGASGTITITGKLTFAEARKVMERSNALRAQLEKAHRLLH